MQNLDQNDAADPRRWGWRRACVFLVVFCAFGLLYAVVIKDAGGAGAVAAVNSVGFLLTTTVLAYIFAPTIPSVWTLISSLLPKRDGAA